MNTVLYKTFFPSHRASLVLWPHASQVWLKEVCGEGEVHPPVVSTGPEDLSHVAREWTTHHQLCQRCHQHQGEGYGRHQSGLGEG